MPSDLAIVTGASSGIGLGFAHALAARGNDVVLVARRATELEALASAITAQHGVGAHVVAGDLADAATLDALEARCASLGGPVRILVNNAGFGWHGPFENEAGANATSMIRLNIEALVALSNRFLPGMLARKNGAIINVASTASFQPVPYMAVYGATKAFVLSFSEALAEECRGRGVRVVALCPGMTETDFFKVAGESAKGRFMRGRTVADVVSTGLRALDAGHTVAIDGFANTLMAESPRFAPRAFVARLAARVMK